VAGPDVEKSVKSAWGCEVISSLFESCCKF
jgi:hypothetical protein